jgi:hypothetical protein
LTYISVKKKSAQLIWKKPGKNIQHHGATPTQATRINPLKTSKHHSGKNNGHSPCRREDDVTTMRGVDTGRSNVEEEEANPPRRCAKATPMDSIECNLVVRDQHPHHCQSFGAAAPTFSCSATPSESTTPPSGTTIPTYHRSHSEPRRRTTQPPTTQTG